MPTLYVTEPGARVEKEYRRLSITLNDERLLRVPLRRVTLLVAVGRVGITTPAVHALLRHKIPIHFVSRSGKLLGRLLPPTGSHLPRRQVQYARNQDHGFAVNLARSIGEGKIYNQRVLALRIRRRNNELQAEKELALIQACRSKVSQADNLNQIRGLEGTAARAYFACLRQAFDGSWRFEKRTRRPPTDPINAVLSLGYTILTQAMMTALETAGLDPYLGYFHGEKYGRPALALDLVEEFRAPVVDSLALSLFNKRQLRPVHFEKDPEDGGIILTDRGLRIFFTCFSQRLEAPFKSRRLGRKITFRKLFEVQARALARVIEGDVPRYRPFRLR